MHLQDAFAQVYVKFKLRFYQNVFIKIGAREASLTTMESFCMEIIQALNKPTVNEFANFVQISSPNAAYKINSLIQKGYLQKVQSINDRREYHIIPTEKYYSYYNISNTYLTTVLNRVHDRFPPEDVKKLEEMLTIISSELMPELPDNLSGEKM